MIFIKSQKYNQGSTREKKTGLDKQEEETRSVVRNEIAQGIFYNAGKYKNCNEQANEHRS